MMLRTIRKFFREESGATVVEYAILVSIISIAAIVVIVTIRGQVNGAFALLHDQIEATTGVP